MTSGSPVCVVTGAAGALGSALVHHLVQSGYRVAALGLPADAGRLEALGQSEQVLPVLLDVTNASEWTQALSRIEHELGAPTGAALIAGGWKGGKPLHQADGNDWSSLFAMNVETAYASLRALLQAMLPRGSGSIVVVGSRAAVQPWESAGAAAYAASKAAVVALAQAAAAEVSLQRIRVNAILPSVIDTPQNRAAMPQADASRWVTAESICGVIEFLLSDAARDISGAALPVYGRA
jgi:NAD(P)-dependent dehydrogenase (short-subunit alcohol dehydrogenase family)